MNFFSFPFFFFFFGGGGGVSICQKCTIGLLNELYLHVGYLCVIECTGSQFCSIHSDKNIDNNKKKYRYGTY